MALALGRTVAELRLTMGFDELRRWEAYYGIEPWGAARDNMHAGMIAAAIANQNRKRGSRALTFSDFMLTPKEEHFASNRERFRNMLRASAKGKRDG